MRHVYPYLMSASGFQPELYERMVPISEKRLIMGDSSFSVRMHTPQNDRTGHSCNGRTDCTWLRDAACYSSNVAFFRMLLNEACAVRSFCGNAGAARVPVQTIDAAEGHPRKLCCKGICQGICIMSLGWMAGHFRRLAVYDDVFAFVQNRYIQLRVRQCPLFFLRQCENYDIAVEYHVNGADGTAVAGDRTQTLAL